MAEQAVNAVVSAVAGELTNRAFSGLIQRYGKDTATSEKLQRLEMLLIKIHSAVEASEKHAIVNPWMLRCRVKLREAASRGDEVLARFPPPVKDADDANLQQQGEAASSSTTAAARAVGAPSFPKKSLTDTVQRGIRGARKMMFWSVDDDMVRLNKTLGRLERLSPDIGEFIRLLHLEALPKVSPPEEEDAEEVRSDEDDYEEITFCSEDLECDSAVLHKEQDFTVQHGRLQAAFVAICEAVELAGSRDFEDVEWLAYWAAILQEAKQQGSAVLGSINAGKTIGTEDNKESIVEFEQEKDELGSFVNRLEGLEHV